MALRIDGDALIAVYDEPRVWHVRFARNLLSETPTTLPGLFELPGTHPRAGTSPDPRRAVIIDATVLGTYGARLSALFGRYGLQPEWFPLRGGETSKSARTLLDLARKVLRLGLSRRGQPLIAIGGGVTLDLAGLLAGILARGTPLIRFPTTLVGLADAGVAGKTGLNFGGKKNSVGTYDPAAVTWLDLTFLRTLPAREIGNGLAEIAKCALTQGPELWALLSRHGEELLERKMQTPEGQAALREAVVIMLRELADNLRESRLTRTMDFGHTITPTCEIRTQRGMLHGEWVAIDMSVFVVISWARGYISYTGTMQILTVLRAMGLELWHPYLRRADLMVKALQDTARHRGGRQRVLLLRAIGDPVFVDDVTVSEVLDAGAALYDINRVLNRPGSRWRSRLALSA
jgi:3-dehydroquinate synthetase